MYSKNSLNYIEYKINYIEKIKKDIISNYFYSSSILKNKNKQLLVEPDSSKTSILQKKLDIATNFSISKIDLILKDLENKKKYIESISKQNINNEVLSKGKIDSINYDDFSKNLYNPKEVDLFNDLDFKDSHLYSGINSVNTINQDENQKNNNITKKEDDIQKNIESSKILFIDEKINDIENKVFEEINDIKNENKLISQINDNLMLELKKISNNSYSQNKEYKENDFNATVSSNFNHLISKIEFLEKNSTNMSNIINNINEFIEKNSKLSSNFFNNEIDLFKKKISDLEEENKLYKEKLHESAVKFNSIKEKMANDKIILNSSENNFLNATKKLENLERIISDQIDDFQGVENEKNNLIRMFEDKINLLKKDFEKKEHEFNIYKKNLEDKVNQIEKLNNLANNEKVYDLEINDNNHLSHNKDYINKKYQMPNSEDNKKLENISVAEILINPKEDDINKIPNIKDNNISENNDVNKITNIINEDKDQSEMNILNKIDEKLNLFFDNFILKNDFNLLKKDLLDECSKEKNILTSVIETKNNENFRIIHNDLMDCYKNLENLMFKKLDQNSFKNNLDIKKDENNLNIKKDEINNIIEEKYLSNPKVDDKNFINELEFNTQKLKEIERVLLDLNTEINNLL